MNGAGVEVYKRFANLTFEAWQRAIEVNLHGVFHCTQAVLPDMIEAGWGRIVNISSSSTHAGQPFMSAYVAAKSGVNGLTKSLALEYGPDGITVNAVPPGFVDTPMLRRAEGKGLLGGTIDEHIQRTPVRRVGRPEDIAAACSFLISEAPATSRPDPRSERRPKHLRSIVGHPVWCAVIVRVAPVGHRLGEAC